MGKPVHLAAAVASGLLSAEGERRGRRYRAGEPLYRRIGERLGIEVSGPTDVARGEIVAELSRRLKQQRS